MLKKIGKCLLVWLITLCVLLGLLLAASCVPNSAIKENLVNMAVDYQYHEPHEPTVADTFHSIADYYADVVLLGVMWNVDSGDVFHSALDTKYYDGDNLGEVYGLFASIEYNASANTDYTRYWHGSMIYLRPLFAVTDARGAQLAIAVILAALLIFNCLLLISKRHYAATVIFLLSLALVQAWYVPLSFEYCSVFLVLLAVCPFAVVKYDDNVALLLIFSAAGTATAFMDFLTAETLTLLIPLLLVFIIRMGENKIDGYRKNMLTSLGFALSWGAGYALTFPTKWAMASIVTGENKFAAALSSAAERVSGGVDDMGFFEQIFSSLGANLSMLFPTTENIDVKTVLVGLLITAVIIAAVLIILHGKPNKSFVLTVLTIALIPYLRFIFLSNHSLLHCFFTYRAQAAAIMAVLAAVWFSCDKQKIPFLRNKYTNTVKGKNNGN